MTTDEHYGQCSDCGPVMRCTTFVGLAVDEEREACAQIADAENDPNKDYTQGFWSHCAAKISVAIRARA